MIIERERDRERETERERDRETDRYVDWNSTENEWKPKYTEIEN